MVGLQHTKTMGVCEARGRGAVVKMCKDRKNLRHLKTSTGNSLVALYTLFANNNYYGR